MMRKVAILIVEMDKELKKPISGVEAARMVIVRCVEQICHQAQTTLQCVDCQSFAEVIEG